MQLGDLVQVKVAGDDLPLQVLRQQHELQVDRLSLQLWKVSIENLQVHRLIGPQAVQNVQTPPTTGPFQLVTAVGDRLQFREGESRQDQLIVKHSGRDEVGDPAIDDDAGVEDQGLEPFDLPNELDVRNQEPKIVLRLQQNTGTHVDQDQPCDQLNRE